MEEEEMSDKQKIIIGILDLIGIMAFTIIGLIIKIYFL